MELSREDKLVGSEPLHHSPTLRLVVHSPLPLKVIREVTVQIKPIRICPGNNSGALNGIS